MPKLQRTTKSNKGVFIYSNGNSVFIKQPNIMELNVLYQAVMDNIKTVNTVFNSIKEKSQKN